MERERACATSRPASTMTVSPRVLLLPLLALPALATPAVTVDWDAVVVTRSAAPSVLVAADPEWTPEGVLSKVAVEGVRDLAAAGADNIRLLNFNIFPEMSVAQFEEGVTSPIRSTVISWFVYLESCGVDRDC
eukprot:COSAG02_NODE_3254_length_7085_cov_102.140281_2_plen_133_part_00